MTWVAAGVASASATMAGIQYLKNKKQAKKDEANRPKLEIPQEIYQNLSQAEQQALQGMPEEQKAQYLSNLQRSTSFGLSALGTRKAGLSGVAALNQNEVQGYGNLLSMDSAARMQNQREVFGQRSNLADYKMQQFQVNKSNPYYEGIARRTANDGTLFQNLNNAGQMGMYGMGQQKSAPAQQNSPQGSQQMNPDIYQKGMNYDQGIQMNKNQMYGVNQNTSATPNGDELALNQGYNSGFNYGGTQW